MTVMYFSRLFLLLIVAASNGFQVDNTSCIISRTKGLDYDGSEHERGVPYDICIRAREGINPTTGQLEDDPTNTATTSFRVTVDDINDNGPEFSEKQYPAFVDEDIAQGIPGLQMTVIDFDDAREVIHPTTGQLEDDPTNTATISFRVTVDDISDNEPLFLDKQYPAYVDENIAQGIPGLQMTLIDIDDAREVINPTTGQLENDPTNTSTVSFIVTADDISDIGPVFLNKQYPAYVVENIGQGIPGLQMTLIDIDDVCLYCVT